MGKVFYLSRPSGRPDGFMNEYFLLLARQSKLNGLDTSKLEKELETIFKSNKIRVEHDSDRYCDYFIADGNDSTLTKAVSEINGFFSKYNLGINLKGEYKS